tara:strand:+ start:173 stop:1018 length:846 start_codon:yes stop_codon:yes gene_type:complete
MNKELTIIFVSFHSQKRIIKYLKQFKDKFKVIIVENSSDYSLKKKIKRFSNSKVIINQKNTGFGAGSNLALRKVKTKYALQIDLDTKFSNESINKLVKQANKIRDFAIVGPFVKNFKYKKKQFIKKKISKNINQMNFIDGCCLLFNMKQIKKIGFFDTNIFLYYEETDLIKRCVDNSKKVLMIDNIKIYHEGRSSSNAKLNPIIEVNRNWHYMWSKFYYFKKHYNYFYAFIKIFHHFISSVFKVLINQIIGNEKKKLIYKARLSGCINAMLLKKSWFRPQI